MKTPTLALAAALPLLFVTVPAASSNEAGAWVHIRVEEPRERSKVHVNLPLPVVEAALQAAPDVVASGGHIHLGGHRRGHGHDLEIEDLRKLWSDLRGAGDTEIVSVEEGEDRVNVSRKGDLVLVRVQQDGGRESVHVDLPVALVDALFSGSGDELNVRAALAELRRLRGDVVRVDDHGSKVRIWIDETADPEGDR
jgi:hypothetical protein